MDKEAYLEGQKNMFEESLKAYNVHSSIVITLEGACTKYEENWYI